jgi:ATP-dependent DNA helicase RecG
MDRAGLGELLTELRAVGTDHQAVEAKRANQDLPDTTQETLSAFANTDGGTILFGVWENGGLFAVTGVSKPQKLQSDFQAACEQMEPPLRPVIDLIEFEPGCIVISAAIPAVSREQRPCHRRTDGPLASSFIRVGDGDQKLTDIEVFALSANRSGSDFSRSPSPPGSSLDPLAAHAFLTDVRALSSSSEGLGDDLILHQRGVWTSLERPLRPTLAGLLTLGSNPAGFSPAARIAYKRLPNEKDPPGTRHQGKHIEGTIGELLDATLAALGNDLDHVQIEQGGALVDEWDVPQIALREILSNALVHRSFAGSLCDTSVSVDVSDQAVVVTSPGGLHSAADTGTLGLDPIAGLRNLTLVRIGEFLRTPSGGRIVEHQASGIAAADRNCRVSQTMPALFIDKPAWLQVILLRGSLDTRPSVGRLKEGGLSAEPNLIRLLSVLEKLEATKELLASDLGSIAFDARLAARALSPCTVEDAASDLRQLEDAGLLRRIRNRRTPTWRFADLESGIDQAQAQATKNATSQSLPPTPKALRRDGNKLPELLTAIAAAPSGVLTPAQIGAALGVTSMATRYKWIKRAEDRKLIERTTDNLFDNTSGFRLTATTTRLRGRFLSLF